MKESNILKQIELHISQHGGFTIRLNSGTAFQGNIKKHPTLGTILTQLRQVKLCPQGTADLLAVLPNGTVIWIETKTATGTQRESQKNFQAEVEQLGHRYVLARNVEDVKKLLTNGA